MGEKMTTTEKHLSPYPGAATTTLGGPGPNLHIRRLAKKNRGDPQTEKHQQNVNKKNAKNASITMKSLGKRSDRNKTLCGNQIYRWRERGAEELTVVGAYLCSFKVG